MKDIDINEIEKIINYSFIEKKFLVQAFSHSSYTNESKELSYQRLEFIGDAILGYIIAEILYKSSNENEGKMTKERASIVSKSALSDAIEKMNLIRFMRTGEGDIKSKLKNSSNIKCDLFESIVGAICVDNNFDLSCCRDFIKYFLKDKISSAQEGTMEIDYKSLLLEKGAKNNHLIKFVVNENCPKFTVSLFVDGKEVSKAFSKNKKQAEKEAAKLFLTEE